MIKSKIECGIVSLVLLCAVGSASAEQKVVGQIEANPQATINLVSNSQTIGKQKNAYIQGDTVTTSEGSNARINLTSGNASFVVAPNTTMQVVDAGNGVVALDNGAVEFNAAEGFPITFVTSAGSFEVSAEQSLNAIAVFEGAEFAVVAKSTALQVESNSGNVVTNVNVGDAFLFTNSEAKSVPVQAGGSGIDLAKIAIIGGAILGGGLIINELSSDDDDDSQDAQAASPAS